MRPFARGSPVPGHTGTLEVVSPMMGPEIGVVAIVRDACEESEGIEHENAPTLTLLAWDDIPPNRIGTHGAALKGLR